MRFSGDLGLIVVHKVQGGLGLGGRQIGDSRQDDLKPLPDGLELVWRHGTG